MVRSARRALDRDRRLDERAQPRPLCKAWQQPDARRGRDERRDPPLSHRAVRLRDHRRHHGARRTDALHQYPAPGRARQRAQQPRCASRGVQLARFPPRRAAALGNAGDPAGGRRSHRNLDQQAYHGSAMREADLPELVELERILEEHGACFETRTLCQVDDGERAFPLYAVTLGSRSREAPAVGFFGGVHGLERVGTQVLLSFLDSLAGRLKWDERVQAIVSGLRLVFLPLVNPAGMRRGSRANANGVDLMRNAPVQSRERVPFLLGGQRLTPRLPWYRGEPQAPMERESEALCTLVREELVSRPFSIALDCHSGFGPRDRIG